MIRVFLILLLCCFLTSCTSSPQETQILDSDNFKIQTDNYRNILKIEVLKVYTAINKKPYAYPIDIEVECEVLEVYRGSFDMKEIKLVTSKEEVSEMLNPVFGKYIFFFNDEDKTTSGEFCFEYRLWPYAPKYEDYLKEFL